MLLGLEEERKKTRYYQAIREEVLTLAIPALLKAGRTPEQIAEDLQTDLQYVQAFIRSQQAKN